MLITVDQRNNQIIRAKYVAYFIDSSVSLEIPSKPGSLTDFDPTDSDWPSIIRVHPILDWDYSHVWQFLQELEVDWCTLYNSG